MPGGRQPTRQTRTRTLSDSLMTRRTELTLVSALMIALTQTGCGEKPLTYRTAIKPVLDARCVACHLPGQAGYEKTGLRLDSYDALMKGTRFNPVVRPGSSVSSTLYRMLAGPLDPSIRMPHGDARLPKETVAMIGAWIDQGAQY